MQDNVEKIGELFPNCITEMVDSNGTIVHSIDFEALKRQLSDDIIEEGKERYVFSWPGKSEAQHLANTPITMTLRPCREESVNFDSSQNVYIKGDNLDALKLLRETYLGKVDIIYIDPPYNTGKDFVYKDNYALSREDYSAINGDSDAEGNRLFINLENNGRFHTDWLNMLYPRLLLSKDFLSEQGAIFISIDDNEYANLKKICDEIFGERNFVADMIWQSTPGSNTGTNIITVTEHILVFAKNFNELHVNSIPVEDADKYIYEDEYVQRRGKYILNKLDRRMTGVHYSDALNYPIKMPDGQMIYPGSTDYKNNEGWNYRWSQSKVQWGIEHGFIVFKNVNGKWNAYFKQYLNVDNEDNEITRSIPFQNIIKLSQFNSTQGTKELMTLFGKKFFDYPKPSEMMKYLISICSSKNSLIMDFFSGSSSTGHGIFKLNAEDNGTRKFILVQLPQSVDESSEAYAAGYRTICDIGEERLRLAGKLVHSEHPAVDVGFRTFYVDSSNMNEVFYNPRALKKDLLDFAATNIKSDRTAEDLLFQVMLELGVDLSAPISKCKINGKEIIAVDGNYLVVCFDENITDEVVTEIAKKKPTHVVFRDSSMANDSVAINFEQIFKAYSPNTKTRIL